MTKQAIHQLFVDQLAAELASITAAARGTFATATNAEHAAESKYDTFKLESSYLARGQARRVEELTQALDSLQTLLPKELNDTSLVQLGALVRLESGDGRKSTLFFAAAAGGETISVAGEEITLITAHSPLGEALLGRTGGDTFDVRMGAATRTFTVVSVS
jgi:transcription elongation GreA/GreB family factor